MSDEERRKSQTEFLRFQAEQWAWCFPGCLDYINRFAHTEHLRWRCTPKIGEVKRNAQVA